MVQAETPHTPALSGALPESIGSVQPGGGVCYRLELAWGEMRRRYLQWLRPGYVRRMAALRRGDVRGAPHAIVDSRDLKYCCNRCDGHWLPEDDPFAWRDSIPLARWGLAEVLILAGPLVVAALWMAWAGGMVRWAASVPAAAAGLLLYFFRDPKRAVPDGPGLLVAPADGKVVEVARLDYDPFLGGPATRIGIFLSLFNVHINRSPADARVVTLDYRPGLFLNALKRESAELNESMWIGYESLQAGHQRWAVRQISGLVARRIVCALKPGQTVRRGERFGMIKLGSRTELIVPADACSIEAREGQNVRAGTTILARFNDPVV